VYVYVYMYHMYVYDVRSDSNGPLPVGKIDPWLLPHDTHKSEQPENWFRSPFAGISLDLKLCGVYHIFGNCTTHTQVATRLKIRELFPFALCRYQHVFKCIRCISYVHVLFSDLWDVYHICAYTATQCTRNQHQRTGSTALRRY